MATGIGLQWHSDHGDIASEDWPVYSGDNEWHHSVSAQAYLRLSKASLVAGETFWVKTIISNKWRNGSSLPPAQSSQISDTALINTVKSVDEWLLWPAGCSCLQHHKLLLFKLWHLLSVFPLGTYRAHSPRLKLDCYINSLCLCVGNPEQIAHGYDVLYQRELLCTIQSLTEGDEQDEVNWHGSTDLKPWWKQSDSQRWIQLGWGWGAHRSLSSFLYLQSCLGFDPTDTGGAAFIHFQMSHLIWQ